MAVNISLTNLTSLQNETTALAAINANSAAITTAFAGVLSLNGTSPNQMEASLDMNSNEILNIKNGVPAGGTTGQVLKKLSNTDYDYGWANE